MTTDVDEDDYWLESAEDRESIAGEQVLVHVKGVVSHQCW